MTQSLLNFLSRVDAFLQHLLGDNFVWRRALLQQLLAGAALARESNDAPTRSR
jgi:hypothetical protein